MLIQWPDLFYHTTDDTLDKVDPESLRRAGTLAAVYCYFIANAGEHEANWISAHVLGRFKERIVDAAKSAAKAAVTGGIEGTRRRLDARIAYLVHLGSRSLDSIRNVAAIDLEPAKAELEAFGEREGEALRRCLPRGRAPRKSRAERAAEQRAARMVPVRLYQGPVALGQQLRRLSKAKREAWKEFSKGRVGGDSRLRMTPRTAQFWADGTRTILEIADCLEQDTGGERDVEYLVRYFELLRDLKLARIEKPRDRERSG
jgi:hypothetical protein